MLNKKASSKKKPNPSVKAKKEAPKPKKEVTAQEVPAGCPVPSVTIEDDRTGTSLDTLKRAFADHLFYLQGKYESIATDNDLYTALAFVVRDRLLTRWLETQKNLSGGKR